MYGRITGYDGEALYITAPFSDAWVLEKQGVTETEIRLIDGRALSPAQRKKLYALFRDISLYTGHTTEETKDFLKTDFLARTGAEEFSLSDCDMTTARLFIDHVIAMCLKHDIPCRDSLLDRAEDIARYLYLCLAHRKCCICGKTAHVHHVDRIGMGANRNEICHEGYQAMALCWKHHREAHEKPRDAFNGLYHVFGIKLDGFLCKKLKLGKRRKAVS